MNDVLRSMGIAGAILLAVVVLIIIVSAAAINRGEVAMRDIDKHH
jgi:hypothetical protein